MFAKVLVVCLALYSVEVLGGAIKAKLSPEVQIVVQEIDIKTLVLESDIKKVLIDNKHDAELAKSNTKLALKHLKTAVKAGKGTLCGQIAAVHSKAIETNAVSIKDCNSKLNMKELQTDLHEYLKNLHDEAMLVDKYCTFICTSVEEATLCVNNSIAALRRKLADVENIMSEGLSRHVEESAKCFKDVVEQVQGDVARIEVQLNDCLNPTTPAPVVVGIENAAEADSEEHSAEASAESKEHSAEASNEGDDEHNSSNATGGDQSGEDNDSKVATHTVEDDHKSDVDPQESLVTKETQEGQETTQAVEEVDETHVTGDDAQEPLVSSDDKEVTEAPKEQVDEDAHIPEERTVDDVVVTEEQTEEVKLVDAEHVDEDEVNIEY